MRRRPAEGAVLHVTARHCGRVGELQGRCRGTRKKRRSSDAARDALPQTARAVDAASKSSSEVGAIFRRPSNLINLISDHAATDSLQRALTSPKEPDLTTTEPVCSLQKGNQLAAILKGLFEHPDWLCELGRHIQLL